MLFTCDNLNTELIWQHYLKMRAPFKSTLISKEMEHTQILHSGVVLANFIKVHSCFPHQVLQL